jgi:hypothetical protein
MTFMCIESGLNDVFHFHLNLVVSRTKVNSSEKISSMKFIQEVINNYDRKFFLIGQLNEILEIMTHASSTFLL